MKGNHRLGKPNTGDLSRYANFKSAAVLHDTLAEGHNNILDQIEYSKHAWRARHSDYDPFTNPHAQGPPVPEMLTRMENFHLGQRAAHEKLANVNDYTADTMKIRTRQTSSFDYPNSPRFRGTENN